jgi:hypothetical protein
MEVKRGRKESERRELTATVSFTVNQNDSDLALE